MARDSEPVVVGGLRGSGTRVAARLIRGLGVDLGDDVNEALDNQSFAFLLGGRPDWCRRRPDKVTVAVRLFEKTMRGVSLISPAERALLLEAADEWERRLKSSDAGAPIRPEGGLEQHLAIAAGTSLGSSAWGWKNPSAHLFIEQLAEVFPGMKYIHVIREGSELAGKAKTQREAQLWSWRLGIGLADGEDSTQDTVLRYWRLANERVAGLGPRLFGDRFLIFRYERVCAQPRAAVSAVANFLDVDPPPDLAEEFSGFVGGAERPR